VDDIIGIVIEEVADRGTLELASRPANYFRKHSVVDIFVGFFGFLLSLFFLSFDLYGYAFYLGHLGKDLIFRRIRLI